MGSVPPPTKEDYEVSMEETDTSIPENDVSYAQVSIIDSQKRVPHAHAEAVQRGGHIKATIPITTTTEETTLTFHEVSSKKRREQLQKVTLIINIKGVKNPMTGEICTVAQAFNIGLLDVRTGQFIDPKTGRKISLEDAVRKGYLDKSLYGKLTAKYGIRDPKTGKQLTLMEAIIKGLYDPRTGMLRDSKTGRLLHIEEAVSMGIISADSVDSLLEKGVVRPSKMKLSEAIECGALNVHTGEFTNPQTGEIMSLTDALSKDYIDLADNPFSTGVALADALNQNMIDNRTGAFVHPDTNVKCSIEEAIACGYINPNVREVVDSHSGNKLTTLQAMTEGVIHIQTGQYVDYAANQKSSLYVAKEKLLIIKPYTLKEGQEVGLIDEHKGLCTDPRTDNKLTLLQAIAAGVVDTDARCIVDATTDEVVSVNEALRRGLVNSFCRIVDSRTGESMRLTEAVRKHLLVSSTSCLIFEVDDVKDTRNAENVSFNLAVTRRFMDLSRGKLVDTASGRLLTVDEATAASLITPQLHSALTNWSGLRNRKAENISVLQAIMQGLIDPLTGNMLNPNTKTFVTLSEAAALGLIPPEVAEVLIKKFFVFVPDKTSYKEELEIEVNGSESTEVSLKPITRSEIVQYTTELDIPREGMSLKSAIERGLLNATTGIFTVPNTQRQLNMEEAIKYQIIDGKSALVVNPKGKSMKLYKALKKDIIDGTGHYKDSSGRTLTLQGAIDKEYVILESVKMVREKPTLEEPTAEEKTEITTTKFVIGKTKEMTPESRQASAIAVGRPYTESTEMAATPEDRSISFSEIYSRKRGGMPLLDAIKLGIFDPVNGRFKDPVTGEEMSLPEAVKKGHIDPTLPAYIDLKTNTVVSLEEAFSKGKIDPRSGNMTSALRIDLRHQSSVPGKMNIEDAIKIGLLDQQTGQFTNPATGEVMNLQEAMHRGFLDGKSVTVNNPNTGKKVTLETAIETGLVDGVTGALFDTAGKTKILSFVDAMQSGLVESTYDVETGMIFDSTTGEYISIDKAIMYNHIESSCLLVIDTKTGEQLSMDEAVDRGIIDEGTGEYINKATGERITAAEAAKLGLLAIVGAPVLAGMAVTSLIKRVVRDKSPVRLKEVTNGYVEHAIEEITVRPGQTVSVAQVSPIKEKRTMTQVAGTTILKGIKTRYEFSLQEIIKRGLQDPKTGLITHPDTGEKVSLEEALNIGLIDPNKSIIVDPATGRQLSLIDAIAEGVVNGKTGKIINRTTLTEISLSVAEKRGLIKSIGSAGAQLTLDPDTGFVVDSRTGEKIPFEEALQRNLVSLDATVIRDPTTNMELTLFEAVQQGIVDNSTWQVINCITGVRTDLSHAVVEGMVPKVTLVRESAVEILGTDHAQISMRLDPSTGTMTDPKTQEVISLEQGIQRGLINPTRTFIRNPVSGDEMPLSEAGETGIIDTATWELVNTDTGERMPFSHAVKSGFVAIVSLTDTTKPTQVTSIGDIQNIRIDPATGLITDLKTNEELSFAEAVHRGIINSESSNVYDPHTRQTVTITKAIQDGLLHPETLEMINRNTGEKIELQKALRKVTLVGRPEVEGPYGEKTIDPYTGTIFDTVTGQTWSLEEAVRSGIISPVATTIRDPATGNELSLKEALSLGVVDEDTYQICNLQTGEYTSLSDSMKAGLLPKIAFLKESTEEEVCTPVEERALGIDPKTGKIIDNRTGEQMRFEEAIRKNLISLDSSTIVDPATGREISLEEAISTGILDERNLQILNKRTGERTSLSDAVKAGLISKVTFIRETQLMMTIHGTVQQDADTGAFVDPFTREHVSFKEAVIRGHIDMNESAIRDPISGKEVSLHDAVNKGWIDPVTGQITETAGELSKIVTVTTLKVKCTSPSNDEVVAIEYNIKGSEYDMAKGTVFDESTGQTIMFDEAVRKGLIDVTTSKVGHPFTGEEMTIFEAAAKGIIDGKTGRLITDQFLQQGYSFDIEAGESLKGRRQESLSVSSEYRVTVSSKGDHGPEQDEISSFTVEAMKPTLVTEEAIAMKHDEKPKVSTKTTTITRIEEAHTYSTMPGYKVLNSGEVINLSTMEKFSMAAALAAGIVSKVISKKEQQPLDEGRHTEVIDTSQLVHKTFDAPVTGGSESVMAVARRLKDGGDTIKRKTDTGEEYEYIETEEVEYTTVQKGISVEEHKYFEGNTEFYIPSTRTQTVVKDATEETTENAFMDKFPDTLETRSEETEHRTKYVITETKKTEEISIDHKPFQSRIEYHMPNKQTEELVTEIVEEKPKRPPRKKKTQQRETQNAKMPDEIEEVRHDEWEVVHKTTEHVSHDQKSLKDVEFKMPSRKSKDAIETIEQHLTRENKNERKTSEPEHVQEEYEVVTKKILKQEFIIGDEKVFGKEVEYKLPLKTSETISKTAKKEGVVGKHLQEKTLDRTTEEEEEEEEGYSYEEYEVIETLKKKEILEGQTHTKEKQFQIPLKTDVSVEEIVSKSVEKGREDYDVESSKVYNEMQARDNIDSSQKRSISPARNEDEEEEYRYEEYEVITQTKKQEPMTAGEQTLGKETENQFAVTKDVEFHVSPQKEVKVSERVKEQDKEDDTEEIFEEYDEIHQTRKVEEVTISEEATRDLEKKREECMAALDERFGIDSDTVVLRHKSTGKAMSLKESVETGVLDLNTGEVIDESTGEKLSIANALQMGIFSPEVSDQVLLSLKITAEPGEKITVEEMFKTGQLDVNTGMYIDPSSGKYISLEDAINAGLVDASSVVFVHPTTGEAVTLEEAAKQNLIDLATSRVVDPQTGKEASFADTVGLTSVEELFKNGHIDPTTGEFINSATNQRMSLRQAVDIGLLDENKTLFVHPVTGETMTVADAGRKGLIDLDTGKVIDPKTQCEASLADSVGITSVEQMFKDGLIDPKTGEYVDPTSGKKMSLHDAIDAGLLDPSRVLFTDSFSGETTTLLEAAKRGMLDLDTATYVDPKNRKHMPLATAVNITSLEDLLRKGCIDPKTGEFVEASTSNRMPIQYAIDAGLLDAEKVLFVNPANGETLTLAEAARQEVVDLEAGTFVDKNTGKQMSMVDAVGLTTIEDLFKTGVIDLKTGKYVDSTTGNSMSLKEAIESDLLDDNRILFRHPKSGEVMTLHEAARKGLVDLETGNFNESRMKKCPLADAVGLCTIEDMFRQGYIDPSSGEYIEKSTGARLTLKSAVDSGLLDPEKILFVNSSTKEMMTLDDASRRQLLDLNNGMVVDETNKPISLAKSVGFTTVEQLIKEGRIDTQTGEYLDRNTGKRMSLKEAIDAGNIVAENILFIHPITGQTMSVADALKKGYLDATSGAVIDPKTRKQIAMGEVVGITTLEQLYKEGCIDSKTGNFVDSATGNRMTLKEAVDSGILDAEKVLFVDQNTGETMTLAEANVRGILSLETSMVIDPKSGEQLPLYSTVPVNSLEELIKNGCIDPTTGQFINPSTGKRMSLKDAVNSNLLNLDNVIFVHPDTGETMTLAKAAKDGLLDLDTCTFFDRKTNKHSSLVQNVGLTTIGDLIKQGSIDPRTGEFVDSATGERMNLREAIERGLLNPESVVFVHPVTGDVLTLENAARQGLFDLDSGMVTDPQSHEKLDFTDVLGSPFVSFKDANEKGIYDPVRRRFVDVITGQQLSLMDSLSAAGCNLNDIFVRDKESGKIMPLRTAICKGIVDSKTGSVIDSKSGRKIPFDHAVKDGRIFETVLPVTLCDAMDKGIYNAETGSCMDPRKTEEIDLDEAIDRKIIDANSTLIRDSASGSVMALQEAVDEGLIHPQTGQVIDPSRDQVLSLKDAMSSGIIVVAAKPMPLSEMIELGLSDPDSGKLRDPLTDEDVTLTETMKRKLIDTEADTVIDTASGSIKTLTEAIQEGFIDPEAGKCTLPQGTLSFDAALDEGILVESQLYKRAGLQYEPLTLYDSLSNNMYVPDSGKFLDPLSNRLVTLDKAMSTFLHSTQPAVKDTKTGKAVSLADAKKTNILDVVRGTFEDPQSHEILNLNDALNTGRIVKSTKPLSLYQMTQYGLYDAKTRLFSDPVSGEKKTLSNAIKEGLVDNGSYLYNTKAKKSQKLDDFVKAGLLDIVNSTVRDPVTKSKYTLPEALERGYLRPIAEPLAFETAIDEGILNLNTGKVKEPTTGTPLTLQQGVTQGVIDPKGASVRLESGEYVTIDTALKQRLIDPGSGLVIDPTAKRSITLSEALDKGLLVPSNVPLSKAIKSGLVNLDDCTYSSINGEVFSLEKAVTSALIDPTSAMIRNPVTGQKWNLQESMDAGLLDANGGTVTDPLTRSVLSIKDAVNNHLLEMREPVMLTNAIKSGNFNVDAVRYKDPWTGDTYNIKEALDHGCIEPSSATVHDMATRQSKLLDIACVEGYINSNDGTVLDTVTEECKSFKIAIQERIVFVFTENPSLYECVEQGLYDPGTGKITDPSCGDRISIKHGLDIGMISPNTTLIKDTENNKFYSLAEAQQNNLFNASKGTCLDTKEDVKLTLDKALEQGILVKSAEPLTIEEAIRKGCFDVQSGMFRDPITGNLMSLAEAIARKLINQESLSVRDPKTGERISLKNAIEEGILDPEHNNLRDPNFEQPISFSEALAKEVIVDSSKPVTLHEAINQGLLNLSTSKFTDPVTGEQISLQEAISKERISGNAPTIVDSKSGDVLTLNEAMERGLFDLHKAKVVDSSSGEEFTFAEAIQNELIPEARAIVTLHDSISRGIFDPATGKFVDPGTGKMLSLEEALSVGLVDLSYVLVKDTKSEKYLTAQQATDVGILDITEGNVKDTAAEKDILFGEAIERRIVLPYARNLSLYSAIAEENLMDRESQLFIDPTSQQGLSLVEAIEVGVINDELISVRDPRTKALMSLADAIKKGFIDPRENRFVHPVNGERMTLQEALEQGHIVSPPLLKHDYVVPGQAFAVESSPLLGTAAALGQQAAKVSCSNLFSKV